MGPSHGHDRDCDGLQPGPLPKWAHLAEDRHVARAPVVDAADCLGPGRLAMGVYVPPLLTDMVAYAAAASRRRISSLPIPNP